MFNREGSSASLQSCGLANVHSAAGWEELLLPEIERHQTLGKAVVFPLMGTLSSRTDKKHWKSLT